LRCRRPDDGRKSNERTRHRRPGRPNDQDPRQGGRDQSPRDVCHRKNGLFRQHRPGTDSRTAAYTARAERRSPFGGQMAGCRQQLSRACGRDRKWRSPARRCGHLRDDLFLKQAHAATKSR
jgi:hypothetical protein